MAGSATDKFYVAGVEQNVRPDSGIYQHVIAWTSDASGSVTYTGTKVSHGLLLAFETIPDAVAPTDNYDINTVKYNGLDVSGGLLANRDTANTEIVVPTLAATDGVTVGTVFRPVSAAPVIDISAAGDSKKGRLIIHLKA